MNLEYLKTFYTTVRENSISKTAKLLHMSQPGVSVQLQALEKELGFKLLVRSNKGVDLTDAGKIVYDYAVSLLSIRKDIDRELDCLRTHIREMVISSCTTVGSYALPCSLYIFKKNFPNIKVLLDICNSETVINNLLDKSANIGIIQGLPSHCNIDATKIASNQLMLICSNGLCKYQTISLDILKQIPLIIREKGSGSRKSLEENLLQIGLHINDLNVVMELSSSEAIKSAVYSGRGYTILPELSIMHELKSNMIKAIEIEDAVFHSHYYLIHLKENPPKGPEKDFFNFIKSSKRGFCS